MDGRPNLDGVYGATTDPVRLIYMMGLIWRFAQDRPGASIDLLEIGSWCGASALTWADAIALYCGEQSHLACVDAWESYYDADTNEQGWSSLIEDTLKGDHAYDMFRHNMTFMAPGVVLDIHRGRSEVILPTLPWASFDVVYIDGDHTYGAIADDITNAIALVRVGGVICGDDLELQEDECDSSFAVRLPTTDYVHDRRKDAWFHPGVTKAVWERFGRVSAWRGFWAMRKLEHGWQPVSLVGMPMRLPSHIPPLRLVELKLFLMREGLL